MFGSDKGLKAKHQSLDDIIRMCEGHIAAPGKKKRIEATIISAKPEHEMDIDGLDGDSDEMSSDKNKAIEEALNDMDLEDLQALIEEKLEA